MSASTYRREMELLVGRLDSMARDSEARAAVFAMYLSRTLMRFEKDHPHVFDTRMLQMRKTYDIQLKIDFDDPSRHKIAMHFMRKAARTILTQANMIADGREPQIALTTDDFFEGGTIENLQELAELPEDVGDGIIKST